MGEGGVNGRVRGEQGREAGRMRVVWVQTGFRVNGCGIGSDRNM
jgi:hypothetical protein